MNKSEIIRILKSEAKKTGKSPLKKDIRKLIPEKHFYSNFSDYNDALTHAGLTPRMRSKNISRPSKNEVCEYLKALNMELGRPPKFREVVERKKYNNADVVFHFGKYSNALLHAGIQLPKNQKKIRRASREELIDLIKKTALKLGRAPILKKDILPFEKVNQIDFKIAMGGYPNALRLAGFSPIIPANRIKYRHPSKKKLIAHLQELAKKLDRTPMYKDIIADGKYTETAYKIAFGTFNNAFLKAGLSLNRRQEIDPASLTQQMLLDYLKEFSEKIDKVPTCYDVIDDKTYTIKNFSDLFGSFADALQQAGLKKKLLLYSKEQILVHLKILAKSIGRTPNNKEIGAYFKTELNRGLGTLYTRFESINKALELAGLDLSTRQSSYPKRYSNQDLLDHLKELYQKYNLKPTYAIINYENKYNPDLYAMRFKSLTNATELAGLHKGV